MKLKSVNQSQYSRKFAFQLHQRSIHLSTEASGARIADQRPYKTRTQIPANIWQLSCIFVKNGNAIQQLANEQNTITLRSISITIASSTVEVADIFIDGYYLQQTLKANYDVAFSKGRYREPFLIYMGRMTSDNHLIGDTLLEKPIPSENETTVAALYGCTDGCCVYLYVKVSRKENCIRWEQIGRNAEFIVNANKEKHQIEWLHSFQPLVFDFETYDLLIQKLVTP